MKLSIIIPCYKVEQYLDQCIESVVAYKGNDIEIILVDDGSPDRVPQMCDDWAEKDHRIKVIHQQNGGLSVARNTGLEASCGEYLWFIDSDDWIKNSAIEKIILETKKNPDIDIIVTPLEWTYDGNKKNWIDIKIKEDTFVSGQDYLNRFKPTIGASPRNIIKRSVIDSAHIRFYPGIIHEDGLFGIILYKQANKLLLLKDSLYSYRQREASIMHSVSIKSAYSHIVCHQELMKYMHSYLPQNQHNEFRKYCIWQIFDSISFVWKLKDSQEFEKFIEETFDYRKEQCELVSGNPLLHLFLYLLTFHPKLCYYYTKGFSMMISKQKHIIKQLFNIIKTR